MLKDRAPGLRKSASSLYALSKCPIRTSGSSRALAPS